MRNTTEWRTRIIKEGLDENLCDVELGLYLLQSLIPNAPASSLWVLLTGYPFSIPESKKWNKLQHRMYVSGRHFLTEYRRPYIWSEALKHYREFPTDQRGYEVSESLQEFKKRSNITTANFRFDLYAKTLKSPVPLFRRRELKWAEAEQTYKCAVNGIIETVKIPPELVKSRPPGHNLSGKSQRDPLCVSWEQLEKTAEWMDKEREKHGLKPQQWKSRIESVRLQVFDDNDSLVHAESLTINKMMHLVGMVSSGKSNLMKVLAVWAVQKGLHVTLVVGDVLQIFELGKTFAEVGITNVAPILGNSNRKSHINRLHQAVYNTHPEESFNQAHPGFQWVSNTCLLSGLVKPDMTKPFEVSQQPCLSLKLIKKSEQAENDEPEGKQSESLKEKIACSAYSVCSYHQKERDLATASIWIATPGSLVYSRVPQQINRESLLYAELVYRRSDLVIVDEVDQYQAYLDKASSPEQTLRRPTRDAWLDEVLQKVEAELVRQNSQPLRLKIVSDWWDACQQAKRLTDQIYRMLGGDYPELSQWQTSKKYFTDWLLLREIAIDLSENKNADNLMKDVFEPYINDLDNDKNTLFTLTHKGSGKAEAIRNWVKENAIIPLDSQKIQEIAVKLEFALLVCVLQDKLYFMMRRWRQVQDILKLEPEDSMWFEAPPSDYNAIIPAMPMGNQLAFQYHKSYKEPLGSLRFFRCTGVGRWLLLHFNELFASDNIVSPHLLLMSGTSWAGKSSAYHVDIPVTGVLSPDTSKKFSITSEFLPLYDDDHNQPIFVSGAGDKKPKNLEKIVTKLVEEEYLDQKLTDLKGRKILLVVNSYEQVKIAHERLIRLGWGNRVIALTRDDEKSEWLDNDSKSEIHNTLQRGQVSEFANKPDKVILIAPLKAIERGHNIVDDNGMAAIGAAYFLVLPHPTPDDLSYAIHSINRWAIDNYKKFAGKNLEKLGKDFRDTAYHQWLRLLHLPVKLRTLKEEDLMAVHWDIAVSLWQVVGRLIRGSSDAELFWCDAKFGLNVAQMNEQEDTPSTSILVGIRDLLQPYFEGNAPQICQRDRQIVQALYKPFYEAINNTRNLF